MTTKALPTTHKEVDTGGGKLVSSGSRKAFLALAVVAVLVMVLISLVVGSNRLPVDSLLPALLDRGDDEASIVIWELRVPRAILGVFVGTSLGVAGALVQAMTRNPLADPGILGVNAGAAFAVALGISVAGATAISDYVWFAMVGALIASIFVYFLGGGGRVGAPLRLTLAGGALGAVLSGVTTALTLLNPDAFDQMRFWQAGSLSGSSDLGVGLATRGGT